MTAADKLGYPVALKAQSRQLPHKAQAGGVSLGRRTPAEVADAFRAITGAVPVPIDGVLVQAMAAAGLELLIGVENRSGLGPMVIVGYGGALVELINRTAMFPAPFDDALATELLHEIGVASIVADGRLGTCARLVAEISQFAWHTREHRVRARSQSDHRRPFQWPRNNRRRADRMNAAPPASAPDAFAAGTLPAGGLAIGVDIGGTFTDAVSSRPTAS